jgi:hypothetical protein
MTDDLARLNAAAGPLARFFAFEATPFESHLRELRHRSLFSGAFTSMEDAWGSCFDVLRAESWICGRWKSVRCSDRVFAGLRAWYLSLNPRAPLDDRNGWDGHDHVVTRDLRVRIRLSGADAA